MKRKPSWKASPLFLGNNTNICTYIQIAKSENSPFQPVVPNKFFAFMLVLWETNITFTLSDGKLFSFSEIASWTVAKDTLVLAIRLGRKVTTFPHALRYKCKYRVSGHLFPQNILSKMLRWNEQIICKQL